MPKEGSTKETSDSTNKTGVPSQESTGSVESGSKGDTALDGQDRDIGPLVISVLNLTHTINSACLRRKKSKLSFGAMISIHRGQGYTVDEVVEKVLEHHNGKMGIREKVLEIIERKCKIVDNADGNFVWVSWK